MEETVKPVKKVFVTAQKKTAVVKKETDKDEGVKKEVKIKVIKAGTETVAETAANKTVKPKPKIKTVPSSPTTPSAPVIASAHTISADSTVTTETKEKKKPRKRNKSKKKTEIAENAICKEIQEINLNSPVLSVAATPFVPKTSTNAPTRKPVSRPKPKLKEGSSDLRSVEVNQLKIRFSPTGFTESKSSSDDSITLQCVLPITDPDFAYDLDSVRIEILLPRGYPGNKESPIRPNFVILNSDLPAAISSRIERNLKWGLNSLDGGILVCRPMLRYLEDNLEKWMVDDVRESAFKFVKPSEIKITEKAIESASDSESDGDDDSDNCDFFATEKRGVPSANATSRISKGDWLAPAPVSDQSSVGGNGFTLKLYFSTIRGVDLLTSQNLTFLACCDRCKFNFPVEALRPFVDRIEHCPKCTSQTKFYYKSQLVTPGANFEDDEEFEGVLGSIRFLRAKPVDLLPSLYQCACSRCYGSDDSESTASSAKIEKVKIGEIVGYGCFNCHQKVRFQIDRIEWIPESVGGGSLQKTTKKSSTKSGPTLSVGNPLPQNGACEHYKKSFRWYRFPCCGQAFPCDECHAKDPVAKDHPVEWANRFICGYCSREQAISVKECPECGKDTSAAGRRKSPFWEGGKGTRNQVLMSRKDSKKYKDYSTNSSSTPKKKPAEK